MTLQSYQYGFLERLWLKLEARSADKNTENIITILPVVLFMQKEQLDTLLEKLPTILTHYLKPHLIQRVFSHIVIKLKSYAKNLVKIINSIKRISAYLPTKKNIVWIKL